MKEVESETKFLWRLLLDVLLLPITFIMIIFRKRESKDLLTPFKDIFDFVYEAKFTFWIIIINIVAYGTSLFLPDSVYGGLMTYPSDMLSLRIYTLITSGFLHASLEHLFGNMLALFIFGRVVEKKLSTGKTALIYFMALIISGLIDSSVNLFLLGNDGASLGASGAIMGLISAAILLSPFYITWEVLVPLPIFIVGWLAIYADITGILGNVDDGIGHFAHLGGFISIAIILFFLEKEDRKTLFKGLMINVASLIIFGLLYMWTF